MGKPVNEEARTRPEYLEQIRDIIFGPQKREFETRLRQLEEKLDDMKSSLAYAMEELTRSLTLELRSSSQLLENKLKALHEQSGQDRNSTQRHIEAIENRFDKALQNTIHTAAERITSLDLKVKSENSKLQNDLARLKQEISQDLAARADELAGSKVSRETMAEALIELGMKVRTGERLSELKLISQKKPG
jgi:exonuclease VII large subunit